MKQIFFSTEKGEWKTTYTVLPVSELLTGLQRKTYHQTHIYAAYDTGDGTAVFLSHGDDSHEARPSKMHMYYIYYMLYGKQRVSNFFDVVVHYF